MAAPRVDIIGSGFSPAAAAWMSSLAGLETRRVPCPSSGPDRHIILPASTLALLHDVGLDPLVADAAPIRTHDIDWPAPTVIAGRPSGVQLSHAALVAAIEARCPNPAAPPPSFDDDRDPIATLIAEAAALPEACHPAPAAPTDSYETSLMPADDRFPPGHHRLVAEPEGWSWSIRVGDHLQVTRVSDSGIGARITPSVPRPRTHGRFVPIGRAAGSVSPLSSLGTAHALLSARAAVSTVRATVADPAHFEPVRETTIARARLRLFRVHALVAHSCAALLDRFDTAFWRARARDSWRDVATEDEIETVVRSRNFTLWARDDNIGDRGFCAVTPAPYVGWGWSRGRFARESLVGRGRTVGRAEWSTLLPTWEAFRTPRTVAEWLRDDRPADDADRKRLVQSVGVLYEANLLDPV